MIRIVLGEAGAEGVVEFPTARVADLEVLMVYEERPVPWESAEVEYVARSPKEIRATVSGTSIRAAVNMPISFESDEEIDLETLVQEVTEESA